MIQRSLFRDPAALLRCRAFLSAGHDEYRTIEMFRNVRVVIAAGVNVAFLPGNAVCGRILLDETERAFERAGVYGPPGGMRDFAAMASLAHERLYANELVSAHPTGPVTGGTDAVGARSAERRRLHRDDLPRPQGKLRLQRRHLLVGRRAFVAAGSVRPSDYTSQRGPDPRVQRITHNLLRRAIGS